jgi:hypothetical protein
MTVYVLGEVSETAFAGKLAPVTEKMRIVKTDR